uniref:Uncharacterized protein n=1 Tax=Brassica campestris TaxID=3711 RepID=M4DMS7_BRACM
MYNTTSYVNLLNSQSSVVLESPEPVWFDSQGPDESVVESAVKVRRKWSPKEDKIHFGAWLNTKEELSQLQAIMEVKQKLSKQKLLDRLLAKKDPLTEMETSLKLKLMSEML